MFLLVGCFCIIGIPLLAPPQATSKFNVISTIMGIPFEGSNTNPSEYQLRVGEILSKSSPRTNHFNPAEIKNQNG